MTLKRNTRVIVSVFGKTDVGRTRDHNEDCFLVADLSSGTASLRPEVREHELGPKGSLIVVADGMGGAAAGEVASEMAAETIYRHLISTWVADPETTPQRFAYRMKQAVEQANQKIHQYAREHPELRGMGTTTTSLGLLGDHVYLAQVGDSRAYLIRNHEAIQLTKDQSLMQRLVDAGEITEEEAERSERRNIILQALGPDARVRVDLTHQQIRRGDVLVLCSDGLSGQVPKEEIAQIVTRPGKDLITICGDLITLANERGGPDNITVVVARLTGEGLKEAGAGDDVGHRTFPLLDPESATQPVPVYRGSPPTSSTNASEMVLAGAGAAAIMAAALFLATGVI